MAWSLAGITIHPGDKGDEKVRSSRHAIQEVLDSSVDVVSYYGAASQRRTIKFILFEDENSNNGDSTLETAAASDANVNLTSDQGSQGSFRILSYKSVRLLDTAHTYPTYDCSAELIKVS